MILTRRAMLQTGVALFASVLPVAAMAQLTAGKALFVLLDEIDPDLPPDLVDAVLALFFDRGIPVAVVLQDVPQAGAAPSPVLAQLRRRASVERGLMELVPAFTPPAEAERYFQYRAATELRRALTGLAAADGPTAAWVPLVSLLDRGEESVIVPYAYRYAGFRVQIRLPRPNAGDSGTVGTQADAFDWGMLKISGGIVRPAASDPAPALALIRSLDGPQLLALSLQGTAADAPGTLLAACAAWADRLQEAILAGALFPTRPMDYLLQGNPGVSKHVALLLDYDLAPNVGMDTLIADLAANGFPFTALVAAGGTRPPSGAFCEAAALAPATAADAGPSCLNLASDAPPGEAIGAEIVLVQTDTPGRWNGPRADGRFQLALPAADGLSFASHLNAEPMFDGLERVTRDQVATPFQRRALLADLEAARRDGRVHFHSVRGLMQQMLAPDPVLERFWSTRRRQITDPPRPRAPDPAETRRYLDDARLAWRYIERLTDPTTGLCAGTALWGNAKIIARNATMWDLASQIQGIISASELAIISRDEATTRLETLLDHLPALPIGGLILPPMVFRTDRLQVVSEGYDYCDVGRFLIALRATVTSGLVAEARAQAVFDRWEIAATVRDGQGMSFLGGQWVDHSVSHCTPYVRRGFAAWGIAVHSSYPESGPEMSGDDRLRLLYQAAFLGHYATEPPLLEAVELGHSAHSKYLADVLFDSQLGWFEATGTLKCVSEAPLHFAPWFTYQGLRVDRSGADAWVVATRSSNPEYQTEAFRTRTELINSKAAFLWATAYPHPYSTRLLELIRAKARIADFGFSPGVFAQTQRPLPNYSDLNTNGIILLAIARALAPAA